MNTFRGIFRSPLLGKQKWQSHKRCGGRHLTQAIREKLKEKGKLSSSFTRRSTGMPRSATVRDPRVNADGHIANRCINGVGTRL